MRNFLFLLSYFSVWYVSLSLFHHFHATQSFQSSMQKYIYVCVMTPVCVLGWIVLYLHDFWKIQPLLLIFISHCKKKSSGKKSLNPNKKVPTVLRFWEPRTVYHNMYVSLWTFQATPHHCIHASMCFCAL